MKSAYPGKTPEEVKTVLMPVAKMIAYDFGIETKTKSLVVTDELMDLVGLCILGALSCGAHAVLHRRMSLLSIPEVSAWADMAAKEAK